MLQYHPYFITSDFRCEAEKKQIKFKCEKANWKKNKAKGIELKQQKERETVVNQNRKWNKGTSSSVSRPDLSGYKFLKKTQIIKVDID